MKYQFFFFLKAVFSYYHEFDEKHSLLLYDSESYEENTDGNDYLSFKTIFSTASIRPPCFILMERFEAFDCLWLLLTCFNETAL